MKTLTKRATIYFDPALHRTLRLKSVETEKSISDLVGEAIRHSFAEDASDLAACKKRAHEPDIPFGDVLKRLKADGKI